MTFEYLTLAVTGITLVVALFVLVVLLQIKQQVDSLFLEFLPKGGSSISLRINELKESSREGTLNASAAKSAVEEMRSESRAVRETNARQETLIGTVRGQLDAILLAQAGLAREQAVIVNLVQRMDVGAANAPTNTLTAGAGAHLGSAALGHNMEQTKTDLHVETIKPINSAVAQAQEGVSETQAGVEKIKQGIDQLKEGN